MKAYKTLEMYVNMASGRNSIGILVSCDDDDTTMTNPKTMKMFQELGKRVEWFRMDYRPNKTKIEACNSGMKDIDYPWDIVLLASDDMIPEEVGYDGKIRLHMRANFPNTNGILWFSDGVQKEKLNTLSIMGRAMYESFGYIYNPEYKSFFCDTEFTDLCKTTLRNKCSYISYCIIRHNHFVTGATPYDELYMRNDAYWYQDVHTYISRKTYPYNWSVLIPTIPGRERSLAALQESIREKMARICPDLTYEIRIEFDNRIMSIGSKRQKLLQAAQGKYMSFIDDDDEITDAYIEDLRDCIHGNYHVMRLKGQIGDFTFVHTLEMKRTDTMATETYFRRLPNHLNPMLTYAAKGIAFQDAVRGEDLDWSIRLSKCNYLRTQYTSAEERIHYIYNMGERKIGPEILKIQQTMTPKDMLDQVFVPRQVEKKELTMQLGSRGFVSR